MDLIKFLMGMGVNIDPKKVNEVTEFTLKKLVNIEQAFTGIDAKLGDLVELEKEKVELLKKGVKK